MKPYYSHAGITIYHADCREVLPTLPKVDCVITDPPYGIGASAGVGKYGRLKFEEADPQWDHKAAAGDLLGLAIQHSTDQVIWGMNYFSLPPSRMYLVWDKGAGFKDRDFAECELAWCSVDGNAKLLTRDPLAHGDYRQKQHPTQKPLAVMLWCLGFFPKAQTILDPFMGSGTTLLAAKQLGRQAIGIELEEKYCEIAAKRLSQEMLPIFDTPTPQPEQTTFLIEAS